MTFGRAASSCIPEDQGYGTIYFISTTVRSTIKPPMQILKGHSLPVVGAETLVHKSLLEIVGDRC